MDRQDCELVVGATTQVMGYAPGSPEYITYHAEYMAGWDALLAVGDSDGDQRLTLAEFCTAYDKLMAQPAQFDAVILGFVKTAIALWDSNHDWQSVRGRVQELSAHRPCDGSRGREAFCRLDLNGDGYLSRGRIVRQFERILL